ncbi:hypothetical protein [Acaryochloris sp. 'Moss Beach']|uniref:hypothetical protein n=1 Tax=Acaryochloris sp. 'Moss Beach' TaxID=2740837 RepID=UPI001F2DB953|nr:hypothetical protein [Acaryochloris sp. 'Moss Beach']
MTNHKSLTYLGSLIFAFFLLISCQKQALVSKEKYDQLKLDMSYEEVKGIMGSPGKVKKFPGQPSTETTYVWKQDDSSYRILVTLKDGKVGSLVDIK